MSAAADELPGILADVRCVLLDFDGPVCSIFAHRTADEVTARLRAAISDEAEIPNVPGPHEALTAVAKSSPQLAARVETVLAAEELAAADSATATPGAAEFLAACAQTGRAVVIVSNNHGPAVRRYLDRSGLTPYVAHIVGRDPHDASLMKPHPHLLQCALTAFSAPADAAVLIGDSTTDMQAAQAAGVHAVGYANKPRKHQRLTDAGAAVVISDMHELAATLQP